MSERFIDLTRCIERVIPAGSWHSHQCARKRKLGDYCTTHHPDNVKARREAADARYLAREANRPIYSRQRVLSMVENNIRCRCVPKDGVVCDRCELLRKIRIFAN